MLFVLVALVSYYNQTLICMYVWSVVDLWRPDQTRPDALLSLFLSVNPKRRWILDLHFYFDFYTIQLQYELTTTLHRNKIHCGKWK